MNRLRRTGRLVEVARIARPLRMVRTYVVATLLTTSAVFGSEIWWRGGAVETRGGGGEAARAALVELNADPGQRHIVVQFDGPVSAPRRAGMAAAGLRLLSYLGDDAYFAVMAPEGVDLEAVFQSSALVDARAIRQTWKLHPILAGGAIPSWAVVSGSEEEPNECTVIGAYLLFHRDIPLDPNGLAIVEDHGATVRSLLESINGLVIELPVGNIPALADEDAVQWIEPPLPAFTEVNDRNGELTQADIIQADPEYGLDGSGVCVLLYDGRVAEAGHPDFGGRLTAGDEADIGSHATHVAGTIGGSGFASAGRYRGMAPGVTVASYGFEVDFDGTTVPLYADPGDFEADYTDAVTVHNVDLANNSIGTNTCRNGFDCAITGDYGVMAHLIDAVVAGALGEPFRIVWSNGNERGCRRCREEGVHTPEGYHSTAPPACAKNHLTVGAVNANDDSMAIFSSWGPTDDGRLKPDVVAPGCEVGDDFGVTSCAVGGGYTTACGTSMSAPTVTGLAALLIEDFRVQFPDRTDPLNSTLKALFAHNAADLGHPGPDYQSGYGSVRIRDTIDFVRTGHFREGQVDQGERYSLLIEVEPEDVELKVTVAWDDAPGAPNVARALVNDLDLRVYDPWGGQHFPWILDPDHPDDPAGRTRADHLNNIEQVVVDEPTPGLWLIEVYGYTVPEGPQSFSLCASPGIPTDCDGNGEPDAVEILADPGLDCSGNGLLDVCEVDCNDNGVADSCEIVAGTSADCNHNEIADECDADCNDNGTPDECDVLAGTSDDCNHDGIPDDCEPDCNANGIADGCDITGGTSPDCDRDGVPDECQDTTVDCNANALWDACETAEGLSEDLNHNGVPDDCEDRARTWYVDASNCPGPGAGSADDPFCTIQTAIDAAISGNTIVVGQAVYAGVGNRDLDFGGRLITLRSTNPSDPAVVAATVIDADHAGRGLYFHSGETAQAVVEGLTIRHGLASVGNSPGSNRGGGVYCLDSSPTIRRCVISDNHVAPTIFAEYGGGGIYLERSQATIRQCTITGNTTANPGGGIYCMDDSHAEIRDCLIHGNTAYSGGGIACALSHATIRNCTIADNFADGYRGGGIHCNQSLPTIRDSIVWGNVAAAGTDQISGDPTVSYSDVAGGWPGLGNLDADPLFANPTDGDYHLTATWPAISPCIDAGDPTVAAPAGTTDIDGDPRVLGGRVDIGADEYIDTDCNNNGIDDVEDIAAGTSGDCNENGVPDECEDCNGNGIADECDIARGISEDRDYNGIPDECEPSRVLYVDDDGRFDPGPGDPLVGDPDEDGSLAHPYDAIQEAVDDSQPGDAILLAAGLYRGEGNRDIDFGGRPIRILGAAGPEHCIIDAEYMGRGFLFQSGESTATRLEGVTIRHGMAETGAGIFCDNSDPVITNCIIVNNTALVSGGGVYCDNSGMVIKDCTLSNNHATGHSGGGMYCLNSSPTIRHTVMTDNTADYGGGGLFLVHADRASVYNCRIADNIGYRGGGIYVSGSNLVIRRSTIGGNNGTAGPGSGIYGISSGVTIRGSILWDNPPWSTGGEIYLNSSSRLNISFSDVRRGPDGITGTGTTSWESGNLYKDPLFFDSGHGNYHLLADSPCINAGDPGFVPTLGETDLDGDMRFLDGRVDMGADEFHHDCNRNGKPDALDLAEGNSLDCNRNHWPDDCEPDCNENGKADSCDIAEGGSDDCNDNGIPDECDLVQGTGDDVNGNAVLDECERCRDDAACADALYCNGIERCVEGGCVAGADPCPNGLCREDIDACVACLINADCDDENECTDDRCREDACQHVPLIATCDDGDRCTVDDACVDGLCGGTPVLNCRAIFSLRASAVNSVPLDDGPSTAVTVHPGNSVTCEIFVENWQPQLLNVFQATIDSTGYTSGPHGALAPLIDPNPAAGAFINQGRPDFVFFGIAAITAVADAGPDYQYGGLSLTTSVPDPGGPAYCGSLILNVPTDAAGLFEVGFVDAPLYTFLLDRFITVLTPLELEALTVFVDRDCNENFVPDDEDIAGATSDDCTGNGIPDECEPDCNRNGRADSCDILDGVCDDCNHNGTPDDCEPDCNGNHVADSCDIADDTSEDCNDNAIPDECDLPPGPSRDCNDNGVPDECEPDCNLNGVPDDCDLEDGVSRDCNTDGIPDECERDCNANGVADDCDVSEGTSPDREKNGIPDECQKTHHIPGNFATIQEAVDAANPGDSIVLSAGTYSGEGNSNVDFRGKVLTLRCENGAAACVIDGQGNARGLFFNNGEGPATHVEGLTITNSNIGVLIGSDSGPLIRDCNIQANHAVGIFCSRAGSPIIRRCLITGNDGYGVFAVGSNPLLQDSTISGNVGYGIVGRDQSHLMINNCTVSRNMKGLLLEASDALIGDSVMWDNGPATNPRVLLAVGSTLTVSYTNIEGSEATVEVEEGSTLIWGPGNLAVPPRFVDPDGADDDPNTWIDNDYHLSATSACINAGDPDIVLPADTTDIDGQPRVLFGIIDMGSDEADAFLDCDDNGIPDAHDILFGTSGDCNDNAVPDECDISEGTSEDCNTNGVPDECDVAVPFRAYSPALSPIGFGITQDYTFADAPRAVSDVTLALSASADLNGSEEYLEVYLNGEWVAAVFESEADACAYPPNVESVVVPYAAYNAVVDEGGVTCEIVATSSVNPDRCREPSNVTVSLHYDAEGTSLDENRNGVPDECDPVSGSMLASDPPSGAIDAREPHAMHDGATAFGWDVLAVTFSGDVSQMTAADLSVTKVGGEGPAPDVADVTPISSDTLQVTLSAPIEPGTWTVLTHTYSVTSTCLGYLPGDVDGNGQSTAPDIVALIDSLNDVAERALPTYSTDIDRSGRVGAQDIVRLIDLLNGAQAFDPWLGETLPPSPCAGP